MWSLVLVLHHHGDGSTKSVAKLGTAVNLHLVLLVAGGGERALAGTATRKLRLDVGFRQGKSWGDSVDNAAHGTAVGLAIAWGVSVVRLKAEWEHERRDAEESAEGRHVCLAVVGVGGGD